MAVQSIDISELLKEADSVRVFLSNRLDEQKNWKKSEILLERVYAAFTQQVEFLKSVNKRVSDGEAAIAAIEANRQQLSAELKPLKARVDSEREQLRLARDERTRQTAELDGQILAQQQKLAALNAAVSEKAGQLGAAIARELV